MLIDTFSWDFSIPTSYILRPQVLNQSAIQAPVLYVIDGDTIEVLLFDKKTKVRLLGVDTPETVHPLKPVQEFGIEASNFTKNLLTGKQVFLTFDANPVDLYGRTLAYIWLCPQGVFNETQCTMVNRELIIR